MPYKRFKPMRWVVAVLGICAIAFLYFWWSRQSGFDADHPDEAKASVQADSETRAGNAGASPDPLGEAPPAILREVPPSTYRRVSPREWEEMKRKGDQAVVLGRVENPDGNPIRQARVSLYASRDLGGSAAFHNLLIETETGRDGAFQFSVQTPWTGWAVVDKTGFATAEERIFLSLPESKRLRYVLREELSLLRGVVLDKTTRRPVPDAQVFCDSREFASRVALVRSTTSNARGEFFFERLPVGLKAILSVSAATHLAAMKGVDLKEDADQQTVEILLAPAKALAVRVVDQRGAPIINAKVTNPSVSPMSSATDAEGFAQVQVSGETNPVQLDVAAQGYLRQTVEVDVRQPPQEIVLQESPLLRVLVLNQQGQPLPQAVVVAWTDKHESSARGLTNARGFFETAPRLLPLTSIVVSHAEYLGQQIPISTGTELDEIQVILQGGDSGVAGAVYSSRGIPLSSFRIWLHRHADDRHPEGRLVRLFSQTQGRFVIVPVPEGTYDLTVREDPPGPAGQSGVVRALALRRGQLLSGLLLQLQAPPQEDSGQ